MTETALKFAKICGATGMIRFNPTNTDQVLAMAIEWVRDIDQIRFFATKLEGNIEYCVSIYKQTVNDKSLPMAIMLAVIEADKHLKGSKND